jgi:3',5'-cyclic AMP phosphodiesterase CpdA
MSLRRTAQTIVPMFGEVSVAVQRRTASRRTLVFGIVRPAASTRAVASPPMGYLIHVSDVHLRPGSVDQSKILRSLGEALESVTASSPPALIAVTGDLFDSSDIDWNVAEPAFDSLLETLEAAAGTDTRIVVLPGNHDRRRSGVVGPHDARLFQQLATKATDRLTIAGADGELLTHVDGASGLGARLYAFDSTFLPRGLISAGGWMRREDLLRMASQTAADPERRPVMILMHHHLVPTPLTDVGKIITRDLPSYERALIDYALPRLVANGDCEELTMTALGAGTALSLLHALKRAVVVLHGHKHYPTARVLAATIADEGDVVLASAGSAGTAEPWSATPHADPMKLWPSFNVVRFDQGELGVECVAFSPKSKGPPRSRQLLSARLDGLRWTVSGVSERPIFDRLVQSTEAHFELLPDSWGAGRSLDLRCTRWVRSSQLDEPFEELVEGLPNAELDLNGRRRALPCAIEIPINERLSYLARGAISADREAAVHAYGAGTAHESVSLLNRHGAERAVLSLTSKDARARMGEVFGSLTDLHTGRERPAAVRLDGDVWTLQEQQCPPRSLLRIYWCLR